MLLCHAVAAEPCRNPSLKLLFKSCGFNNVIEIDELDEIQDDKLRITGLPFFGEHADLDIKTKMAWLVRMARSSENAWHAIAIRVPKVPAPSGSRNAVASGSALDCG